MQAAARNDLARLFAEELDELGVSAEAIDVWSTPRRLALIARGLPLETAGDQRGDQGPAHKRSAAGARGFPAQGRPYRTNNCRSATGSGSQSSKSRAAADA